MNEEEEVIIAISGWTAFKPFLWILGGLSLLSFVAGVLS